VRVLGVDGCKGGWVAVALEDGRFAGAWGAESITDVVDDEATVIGVDTSLGETTPGHRAADRAARRFISPRTSTVFPTPVLSALRLPSRAEASAHSVTVCGKGISSQAWGLRGFMLDARPHWERAPDRVREVHPECSFRAIAGRVVLTRKTGVDGREERLALLRSVGIDLEDTLQVRPAGVSAHDVLDAAAVAWTAHRIAAGTARSLPDPPERDDAGRAVAIWY